MSKSRPFHPSNLSTIPILNPRDGWTDRRRHEMKTLPNGIDVGPGKSSGYISRANFMPLLQSDVSANVRKAENLYERTDGQTNRRGGQTSGQQVFL